MRSEVRSTTPFQERASILASGDNALLRKLTLLLSLVFTLVLTAPATAQDVSQIDGLESAYGRIYMFDVDALLASPEAAEMFDPAAIPLIGRTAVFTFEDDEAADAASGELADLTADDAFEGAEAEKEELNDLGDAAYQYTAEIEIEEGMTADIVLIVVQEDENILMAAIVGGEDPAGMALDWAEYMLDAEVEEEEVQLSDDGTSSGGAFELMPGADDEEILGGMLPVADVDVMEEKSA